MVKILFEKDKCLGCKTCELACAAAHSKAGTLLGAIKEKAVSRIRIKVKNGKLRVEQCSLCSNPKCISACPAGALSRSEAGIIKVDTPSCNKCGMCQDACPFGAIALTDYPTVCDRCVELDEPSCVKACPTRALKIKAV
ncbi:4Fe-4S binding protein [Thermosediminibacter oceani]|uniref:Iron-sulfur cluster-binding protein CooF n=1 Tax=Thermosediminibacter oceani (strain ATCC BAA-1034 / DSM 16646 / JW/IW-1228P) TaxID=555079 RepID=D9S2D5_THEOJ|nr:4Fe-4S binding protein [Thermosediminibacter oceani]ADL07562.1 iron-sulfur cluster-binding protein CooF [Thermosediminibacter oceani DSM 16646]